MHGAVQTDISQSVPVVEAGRDRDVLVAVAVRRRRAAGPGDDLAGDALEGSLCGRGAIEGEAQILSLALGRPGQFDCSPGRSGGEGAELDGDIDRDLIILNLTVQGHAGETDARLRGEPEAGIHGADFRGGIGIDVRNLEEEALRAGCNRLVGENLFARIHPVAVAIKIDPGVEKAGARADHHHLVLAVLDERQARKKDAILIVGGGEVVASVVGRDYAVVLGVDQGAEIEIAEDMARPVAGEQGRIRGIPGITKVHAPLAVVMAWIAGLEGGAVEAAGCCADIGILAGPGRGGGLENPGLVEVELLIAVQIAEDEQRMDAGIAVHYGNAVERDIAGIGHHIAPGYCAVEDDGRPGFAVGILPVGQFLNGNRRHGAKVMAGILVAQGQAGEGVEAGHRAHIGVLARQGGAGGDELPDLAGIEQAVKVGIAVVEAVGGRDIDRCRGDAAVITDRQIAHRGIADIADAIAPLHRRAGENGRPRLAVGIQPVGALFDLDGALAAEVVAGIAAVHHLTVEFRGDSAGVGVLSRHGQT